jgi:uncharacterized protein (DUF427 family)
MVKATWNGATIAESDATVIVEGNHYFPRESVHREFLRDSSTTTVCGWKGTAHYYDVIVAGQTNRDAAWYYPQPMEKARHVGGHIAFWKGVQITED